MFNSLTPLSEKHMEEMARREHPYFAPPTCLCDSCMANLWEGLNLLVLYTQNQINEKSLSHSEIVEKFKKSIDHTFEHTIKPHLDEMQISDPEMKLTPLTKKNYQMMNPIQFWDFIKEIGDICNMAPFIVETKGREAIKFDLIFFFKDIHDCLANLCFEPNKFFTDE